MAKKANRIYKRKGAFVVPTDQAEFNGVIIDYPVQPYESSHPYEQAINNGFTIINQTNNMANNNKQPVYPVSTPCVPGFGGDHKRQAGGQWGKSFNSANGTEPSILRGAPQVIAGNYATQMSVTMDFSAATEASKVLIGDGNGIIEKFAERAFFDALISKGGYTGIGATIGGTYGDRTLYLLKQQSGNNPYFITNFHIEANSSTYFSKKIQLQRAVFQGTTTPKTLNYPQTLPNQFQPTVRQMCDIKLLVDGYTGIIFEMGIGDIVTFTFDVIENHTAYTMGITGQ